MRVWLFTLLHSTMNFKEDSVNLIKEKLSFLYDVLYEAGEDIIKLMDPCRRRGKKCLNPEGCCGTGTILSEKCRYLREKGCTVKCLGCKLTFCEEVHNTNPSLVAILMPLQITAMNYHLDGIRLSKNTVISRAIDEVGNKRPIFYSGDRTFGYFRLE